MIVDFAEQRVRQGIKDDQAIHDASLQRFRPIMMTTMAALLGALPIALGYGADGASRRPLGLVVIGGLIVSQFVTLYVTPAIYLYLEEFQERVLDRYSFFRSGRRAAPAGQPAFAMREVNGIKDMKTKKMNQNILHNRSVKFGLLFLGLAIVMSGCAVGPNYKRPTVIPRPRTGNPTKTQPRPSRQRRPNRVRLPGQRPRNPGCLSGR